MNPITRSTFWPTTLFALALCSVAGGMEVEHGGLSIDLPGAWSRLETQEPAAVLYEGTGGARVTIAASAAQLPVSSIHAADMSREIGRRLARSNAFETAEVRAVSVTAVGGVPAYRVRLSLRKGRTEIEQVVYVVGGSASIVVAFSAPPNRFEPLATAFEHAVRRAAVEHGPPLGMSQAASSGFLALWPLAGYILRHVLRRARRAPFRDSPASCARGVRRPPPY